MFVASLHVKMCQNIFLYMLCLTSVSECTCCRYLPVRSSLLLCMLIVRDLSESCFAYVTDMCQIFLGMLQILCQFLPLCASQIYISYPLSKHVEDVFGPPFITCWSACVCVLNLAVSHLHPPFLTTGYLRSAFALSEPALAVFLVSVTIMTSTFYFFSSSEKLPLTENQRKIPTGLCWCPVLYATVLSLYSYTQLFDTDLAKICTKV